MNTDVKSHSAKTSEKCLQEAELAKNNMYLEACLQQLRNFSPFVASVKGLLGVEKTDALKRVAIQLATKWRQPCSGTCGCVNSRVVITLVRATHQCIWGSRVPAHKISVQRLNWEYVSGINILGSLVALT